MPIPTSAAIFGQPFPAPVNHTVLPVGINFQDSVRIIGYVPIAAHEFDGTETTYDLGGTDGEVPVTSVQKPHVYTDPTDSVGLHESLNYMAVLYERNTEYTTRPWLGLSTFIPGWNSGYYDRYITTSTERVTNVDLGNIIGSLRIGMDSTVPPTPIPTTAPAGSDATMRWAAALDLGGQGPNMEMFDFQWIPVFNSMLEPGTVPGSVYPMSIAIKSQPIGREFVATIMQTMVNYVGQGLPMNHAIRIIKHVPTPEAKDYVFEFTITINRDGQVSTKDVVLTLTVV